LSPILAEHDKAKSEGLLENRFYGEGPVMAKEFPFKFVISVSI